MNGTRRAAMIGYLLASLLLAAGGLVYAFRSEFMPYHAAAVGHQWAAVDPAYQVLILALMRALGGTEVALALGIVVLTLKPFREGAAWATWSIAALGLIATAGSLSATMKVAAQTPGNPPVGAVAAWGALILLSLVLSLVGGRGAGSAASDHA